MSGSVPCPTCGQPVPPGRLACPACGTLVGSVGSPVADSVEAIDPPSDSTAAAAGRAEAEPEAAPEPDPAPEWADEPAAPEPEAAPEPDPAPKGEPAAAPDPEAGATPDVDALLGTVDANDAPAWPATAAPLEAWAPRSAPAPAPQAPPHFRPDDETVTAATAGDGLGSGGIVPGAYLPPSSVHRPAPPASSDSSAPDGWPAPGISSRPAAPQPAQGGAWVPPTPASYGATAGAAVPPAATAATKPLVPGRSSILADLPFDAPDQVEGWLVALGSAIAILGFFLPWTASLGTGFDGYFGSWGLGIVSHLPVFIFLVIVAGLAILPNRVATWVRTGVCGMVGGGILFGITWLYLGSDASQLGALLAAVGAVLLIVGGIIAVAPGRAAKRMEGG